jgi:hypothetical protein
MNGMFIDSSVIFDTITADPVWFEWSREQIDIATNSGPMWINGVVYAEVGHGYLQMAELDATIHRLGLSFLDISKDTFFEAAKAFRAYRAHGDSRSAILPDFIIGAHAWMLSVPLLTRDPRRFRRAFPDLVIVAP